MSLHYPGRSWVTGSLGGQDNTVPIFSLHFHRLRFNKFFPGGIGRENRISEPVFKGEIEKR